MSSDAKDTIINIIENIKAKKIQEYNHSYSEITQIISNLFNEILQENKLLENQRLIQLIEIHKQRIHSLHEELLISIEEYYNKEKAKVLLIVNDDLDSVYPNTIDELQKYIESNFDMVLFQISNKLHVRLEIQKMIEQIQLEKQT